MYFFGGGESDRGVLSEKASGEDSKSNSWNFCAAVSELYALKAGAAVVGEMRNGSSNIGVSIITSITGGIGRLDFSGLSGKLCCFCGLDGGGVSLVLGVCCLLSGLDATDAAFFGLEGVLSDGICGLSGLSDLAGCNESRVCGD
jgi:hypothetical protein